MPLIDVQEHAIAALDTFKDIYAAVRMRAACRPNSVCRARRSLQAADSRTLLRCWQRTGWTSPSSGAA